MKRFLCLAALILVFGFNLSAQAQPVQGLIVRLKPAAASGHEQPQAADERMGSVAREAGLGASGHRSIGLAHHLVRLKTAVQGPALDDAMRRLRLHPEVASVEPDVRLKPLALPNDPDFSKQWHLAAPGQVAAINMPPAWDRSTGSSSPVVVAVLDTGVLFSHPELGRVAAGGKLLDGYDFVSEVDYANDGGGRDSDPSDPGDWVDASDLHNPLFNSCSVADSSWHGTFIAAQIAAMSNNGVGVAGINWGAQILPVRVSGKCGALLSDILDAMRWAAGISVAGVPDNASPARIINLSFGGDVACSDSYQSAIDDVTARGVLVAVAAGNEYGGQLKRPADCRQVLAVGALQRDGRKADYSNIGPNMALMAPGGDNIFSNPFDIYSASNNGAKGPTSNGYGYKSGTSFSAPLGAGVASLMLSLNPALTPAALLARLRAGVRSFPVAAPLCSNDLASNMVCGCTTATCGAGMLDAALALAQAARPVAAVAPLGSAIAGQPLALDGRPSAAANGSTLTGYQWSLVSGSALTITGANAAQASVTLPSTPGSWTFKLTVTDSAALSDEVSVTVNSGAAASAGGGGGGASGWAWGALLWLAALTLKWVRRPRAGR